MKLLTVIGARPQFIKAAVVSRALAGRCREVLVHTGQHYDYGMSQVFFDELGLAKPDVFLEVGSGSHAWQTAEMMKRLEPVMQEQRPDLVLVYGDTNSTLAGALVAAKLTIPVAHVEAGLRSFDMSMPEEVNRIVTDRLAAICFAPTQGSAEQLRLEGSTASIEVTGDVMVDLLLATAADAGVPLQLLRDAGISGPYGVMTVHRASNTDDAAQFEDIVAALHRIPMPLVFPAHPRTRPLAERFITPQSAPNVRLVDPLSYKTMVALLRDASLVLTDSGGMQKEAYALGIPCVTLRENTEWVETLEDGWNVLAGTDPVRIAAAASRPAPSSAPRPVYGHGNAAQLIATALCSFPSQRMPEAAAC